MESEIFDILEYTVIGIHILLTFFTISVSLFLIFEWKNNPKSIFRSSYFVILNIGYLEDILFSVFWIYGHLINYDISNLFLPVVLFVQWHAINTLGLWDAVLGLNRCTALAFPVAHKRIWRNTTTAMFIILIQIFPFIVDWKSFTNLSCKFYHYVDLECLDFFKETYQNTAIANIFLSVVSIILILFGIYKSPNSASKSSSLERRIIIQTLFSSISLAALYSVSLLLAFTEMSVISSSIFGYILYLIQFYPSIFILFYVSPIFRKSFIQFYKLNFICGQKSQRKISNKIMVGK